MGKKESGIRAWAKSEHRDGTTGKLIAGSHTHGKWWMYFFGNWDAWRTGYCEHNRKARLPQSFREGDLTPITIIVTLYLKAVEKCS